MYYSTCFGLLQRLQCTLCTLQNNNKTQTQKRIIDASSIQGQRKGLSVEIMQMAFKLERDTRAQVANGSIDPIGNRCTLSSREQQRKNCALWSLRFFFLLSLFSLDGGMTTDIFLWTRKMPYQVIPFLSSLLVYLANNNERPSLALPPNFWCY